MFEKQSIIIFDGVCNLCNTGVHFIIRRDPKKVFLFSPMQSVFSQKLIEKYYGPEFDFDTFLVIKNGVCYDRSDGILEITRDLTGFWFVLQILKIVPKAIRDFFYNVIARKRYQIFGRQDQCMVPPADIRDRFIEF